jgi:hypothetical protein
VIDIIALKQFGEFLANPWLIDLGDTVFKDGF